MNKSRKSRPEADGGKNLEPLITRPKRVAIVALGASVMAYMRESMTNDQFENPFDEVWTLNRGVKGFTHEKLFVMDDFRWIEENNPGYANWLKQHDRPIITSTPYPEYPSSVEYPLNEVLETITDDVFAVNTVSYMLAYAIHIRVQEVTIYGADFIYPDGNMSESGGQAVAYLCGMMRHFGLTHRIPQESTLLYANKCKLNPKSGFIERPLYGWHRKEQMAEKAEKEKELEKARKASLKKGDK
jgi:hypothetical protein|tara:strand:+ start:3162 stop:3890 length:729 start_codon:yes stop_codon:yes gene_type:complete